MNDPENCLAGDDGSARPGAAISLPRAIEDLARLTDDLREVARLFDSAMPGNQEKPTIEKMEPRQFFAALLELRRASDRRFRTESLVQPAWDILLHLMIARIETREMTLDELAGRFPSPAQATWRRLEQLIAAGLVEVFENPEKLEDFQLSLSGDAALRLAELYRARTRG
jgi:hypothetical protein